MKHIGVLLLILIFPATSHSQAFINADLNGTIIGLTSLPFNWNAIPFTDPVCLATDANSATPDLTDTAGPVKFIGIMGNPYSGATFVSGEHALSAVNTLFHEGIWQEVNNLIPGVNYTIRFFQSVVKTSYALDTSGSWIVYFDTTLIGISIPTVSADTFNSINFAWEVREMDFMAQQSSHVFKFLPFDDDTENLVGTSLSGGLRMGIDSISIFPSFTSDYLTDFDSEISLFPNPAKHNVAINLNGSLKVTEVHIIDLQGRVMLKQFFVGTGNTHLNFRLSPGYYLTRIFTNRKSFLKPLIVSE